MARMTLWVHRYPLRDLMDDSLDLFKEALVGLLTVGLLPYLLPFLYVALMRTLYIPGTLLDDPTPEAWRALWKNPKFATYMTGSMLLSAVGGLLSYLAQLRYVLDRVLGESGSTWSAFRRPLKPFVSLLVVWVIYGALVVIVLGLCIVMAAILAGIAYTLAVTVSTAEAAAIVAAITMLALGIPLLTLSFLLVTELFLGAPVALVYERYGPFAALGRSFNIAWKNFRAHFSALYVVTHLPISLVVLLIGAALLLYLPFHFINAPLGNAIITPLFGIVCNAGFFGLLACLQVLCYVDGRCRLDAFDLQLLAGEIGLGAALAQATDARQSAVPTHYPDYSRGTAPAQPQVLPAASAYPDYSAPPPPLESPADEGQPEPPPVAVVPESSTPPPPPSQEDEHAG